MNPEGYSFQLFKEGNDITVSTTRTALKEGLNRILSYMLGPEAAVDDVLNTSFHLGRKSELYKALAKKTGSKILMFNAVISGLMEGLGMSGGTASVVHLSDSAYMVIDVDEIVGSTVKGGLRSFLVSPFTHQSSETDLKTRVSARLNGIFRHECVHIGQGDHTSLKDELLHMSIIGQPFTQREKTAREMAASLDWADITPFKVEIH